MAREPDAGEGRETLDRLSGDWWIYQLRRGHRYATDDVLTAWTALRARPAARRLLDLGAGVGSIGLMVFRLLPPGARLTSVEVLEESVALARRTVAHNGVADRVDVRLGDLRDPGAIGAAPGERFDLITANPPYLSEAELTEAAPDVREHEPKLALVSGPVGDEILDRLAKGASAHLVPGGWLLSEIGMGQGARTKALFEGAGLSDVEVLRDLAGLDRVAIGRAQLRA